MLELADDLKIVDGPDPQEREITELQRKLARYEQAAPQVSIAFNDGEMFWKFSPPPAEVLDEQGHREAVDRVREENPKMVSAGERQPPARLPGGIDLAYLDRIVGRTGPSGDEIERYNQKLDEFYDAYLKHLKTRDEHRGILERTIPLALLLDNAGTAPADDLDVFLEFPTGVIVVDAEDFPSEPAPPTPPERPRSRSILDFAGFSRISTPFIPDLHRIGPNVSGPSIEDADSFTVSYHIRRLKHNQQEGLDELRVIFALEAEIRSFSIDYRIHVGNLPDEVVGKLHVAIDGKSESDEGSG